MFFFPKLTRFCFCSILCHVLYHAKFVSNLQFECLKIFSSIMHIISENDSNLTFTLHLHGVVLQLLLFSSLLNVSEFCFFQIWDVESGAILSETDLGNLGHDAVSMNLKSVRTFGVHFSLLFISSLIIKQKNHSFKYLPMIAKCSLFDI